MARSEKSFEVNRETSQRGGDERYRSLPWRESWPEPFDRLRRMAREMDMLFERLVGSPRAADGGRAGAAMRDLWAPRTEVTQAGDELVIRTDLPGTRREDVAVEVQEARVVIQGERRSSREGGEAGVHSSEFTYGHFYREVPLPPGAQPDTAHASLRDGVLEVRIHAPGRRQGRRLEIEESAQDPRPEAENAGATRSADEGGKGDWHLGR